MRKGNWTRAIAGFAMLFILSIWGVAASAADEVITVGVTCEYGQTEAREMLKLINDFRTSGTAWCWDEKNETKVPYTGLSELTYDYGLEQIAMQRAAEIALVFSHTRPNGEDCWSAYTYYQGYEAENIAAGNSTKEATFNQWKEENEKYGGQGHRRNMLSSHCKYIGIGHVYYNGYHYWVQEFGDRATSASEPALSDGEKDVSVEVLSSNIKNMSITSSEEDITLAYGDTAALPEIACGIDLEMLFKDSSGDEWTESSWPGYTPCPVALEGLADVWKVSSGANCISIDTATGKISADSCGEAEITAEVMGKTLAVPVTVTPKDITGAKVTLENTQFTYSGSAFTPSVTVSLDGTELEADKDYSVEYKNNTDAGTAAVIITGKGNYQKDITESFEIAKAVIEDEDCAFADAVDRYTYTGSKINPEITVEHEGRMLMEGTDYAVSCEENMNVGTAAVTVSGQGNYEGKVNMTFRIEPAPLNADTCEIDPIPDQEYARAELTPEVTVRWNGKTLKEDTEYTVTYTDNENAGTAQVEIQGTGNFTDKCSAEFTILPADLEKDGLVTVEGQTYTGEAIVPEMAVYFGDVLLEENTEYTVEEIKNNTNAGEASFTIAGTGNYRGTIQGIFDIEPLSIEGLEFTLGELAQKTYSGEAIEPDVVLYRNRKPLERDTDYSVSYENNTDAGTAQVTVTGCGNYAGTKTAAFEILPLDLKGCSASAEDQTYTGKPIQPAFDVTLNGKTLKADIDYTVSCSSNVNVGTANAVISGTGNYCGTANASFRILPADMKDCQVSEIGEQTYTGSQIRPEVKVSLGDIVLKEETDYTVTYSDNVSIGEAKLTISGKGNFAGEKLMTFTIRPIDISEAVVQPIPEQTYTGAELCPPVTVQLGGKTLEPDADYAVEYKNNTNAGTASVTVTGTGNYSGTCGGTFAISQLELSEEECSIGTIAEQVYTGNAIIPAVEVLWGEKKLTQGVDYTVAGENNINAGTASLKIEGTGNYSGTIGSAEFTILPADISGCTVDPIPAQTFEGAAVEPTVTVRRGDVLLTKEDYTVAYENNTAVGTAKITVTGQGNYTGTITAEFMIQEKPAQTPSGPSTETPSGPSTETPSDPGTETPSDPGTQTPGGSTGSSTQPAKPGTPGSSLPKGTVKKDSKSSAKYKVLGRSGGVVTVEYIAPVNKKKTTVTIPNTVTLSGVKCRVTSIAANAFKNNKKIKKVTIGKYVTTVGKYAFRGCSRLKTLKIGANVTTIKDGAFYGCTALTSVTIPARVAKIGKQAFYNCPKLKKITIKTKKLTQKSVGQKAFSRINSKAVIKVPGGKKKSYQTIFKKRGVAKSVKIK